MPLSLVKIIIYLNKANFKENLIKKFCKVFSIILLTTSLLLPSSVLASERNDKIDALKSSGVVKGYPDGSLGLDKNITRAEIAVVLTQIKGVNAKASGKQVFKDLGKDHWARSYVEAACQIKNPQGIPALAGYPDGSFKASNNITYAEILKILVAANKADLTSSDVDKATWPSSWINWANSMGIIGPNSGIGNFNPNDYAPRGDVFVMIFNSLSNEGKSSQLNSLENSKKNGKETIEIDLPGYIGTNPSENPNTIANTDPKKTSGKSNMETINSFNSGESFNHDRFHQEFLSLVNADRQRLGLNPLSWADDLDRGCIARSEELAKYGSITVNGRSHVRLDGSKWDTAVDYLEPQLKTTTRGENLANLAYSYSGDEMMADLNKILTDERAMAEKFYTNWWNSPGHRDNMMDPKYTCLSVQVRASNNIRKGGLGKNSYFIVGTTLFRGDYRDYSKKNDFGGNKDFGNFDGFNGFRNNKYNIEY